MLRCLGSNAQAKECNLEHVSVRLLQCAGCMAGLGSMWSAFQGSVSTEQLLRGCYGLHTLSEGVYSALQQLFLAFLHWLVDLKTGLDHPLEVHLSPLPHERPRRWQSVVKERNEWWAAHHRFTSHVFPLHWETASVPHTGRRLDRVCLQYGCPGTPICLCWQPCSHPKGETQKRKKGRTDPQHTYMNTVLTDPPPNHLLQKTFNFYHWKLWTL